MTNPSARLVLVAALFVIGSGVGCVPPGAHVAPPGTVALKECGPDGVIDDMEDNNNQITVTGERGGYWYTYVDKDGSTVSPVPGDNGGTFTMVENGHDSKFAAEMKGHLAGKSIVYAAMGLNFLDPKEPLNASAFEGITFFAKRAANTIGKLTIKIPDGNTDPDGQVCSACFNDYGYAINVSEQWTRYVLPFNDMKQEPDWGAPRKPHIDRKRIYAIHFEAKVPGGEFDFFIDDIAFICKG
jgi:hypothetical protein